MTCTKKAEEKSVWAFEMFGVNQKWRQSKTGEGVSENVTMSDSFLTGEES